MKKHQLMGFALMWFILSCPLSATAGNAVSELKNAVGNDAKTGAVFEAILDNGAVAVNDLIALLRESAPAGDRIAEKKDWAAKVTAMNLLAEMKARPALDVLEDMLNNTDNVSAVYNAARTIGRIGGPNAFKILEAALLSTGRPTDDLAYARKKAVIVGLGLCENDQAVPLLQNEMNNSDNDIIIRIYAAGSLGMLGFGDGLDLVTAALNSSDVTVRLAAIRAAGIIGQIETVAELNRAVGPYASFVQRRAVLTSIAQIRAGRLTGDEKVRFIENALMNNSRNTALIQWGTMQLKKARSAAAMSALSNLAAQPGPDMAALRRAARIRMKSER